MPGGAVRIGGTYSAPWIVNSSKQIFRWNGSAWDLVSGWAVDAGDGWVIGHAQSGGGNQIFRWNGRGWDLMPGGAVAIGGTYSAPWIVNSSKQIFRWND
jgi:hypothetical protein